MSEPLGDLDERRNRGSFVGLALVVLWTGNLLLILYLANSSGQFS